MNTFERYFVATNRWALIVLLGWQDACAARLPGEPVGPGAGPR